MSEYDPCVKKNPPRPTTLPEGYELTREYRPPLKGEFYLGTHLYQLMVSTEGSQTDTPFWILKKKEVPKPTPELNRSSLSAQDWGFVSKVGDAKESAGNYKFAHLSNAKLLGQLLTTDTWSRIHELKQEILRRMESK